MTKGKTLVTERKTLVIEGKTLVTKGKTLLTEQKSRHGSDKKQNEVSHWLNIITTRKKAAYRLLFSRPCGQLVGLQGHQGLPFGHQGPPYRHPGLS